MEMSPLALESLHLNVPCSEWGEVGVGTHSSHRQEAASFLWPGLLLGSLPGLLGPRPPSPYFKLPHPPLGYTVPRAPRPERLRTAEARTCQQALQADFPRFCWGNREERASLRLLGRGGREAPSAHKDKGDGHLWAGSPSAAWSNLAFWKACLPG